MIHRNSQRSVKACVMSRGRVSNVCLPAAALWSYLRASSFRNACSGGTREGGRKGVRQGCCDCCRSRERERERERERGQKVARLPNQSLSANPLTSLTLSDHHPANFLHADRLQVYVLSGVNFWSRKCVKSTILFVTREIQIRYLKIYTPE